MTTPSEGWDSAYQAGPPPWDIGRPQPAFVRLAGSGLLSGRVLDAGCGTGEHVLLAAAHGAQAMGVDVSALAIEKARGKAAERGLAARFEVADALHLERLGETFDTVIDSGLFHVFDDADRARYVSSLAAVMEPGGSYFMMCFSDRQPGRRTPSRSTPCRAPRRRRPGWPSSTAADGSARCRRPHQRWCTWARKRRS